MKFVIALTCLTLFVALHNVDSLDTPAIYIGPRRTWNRRYLQPRMAQRPTRYFKHYRSIVPRYAAQPQKYLPSRRVSKSMTIRDLYQKLPYSLIRSLLASRPTSVHKPRYSGIRARRLSSATSATRRRAKLCPWNKIGSQKMNLLLTKLLGEYNRDQPYTLKDVTAGSVRFCKKCNIYGCRPSRHEVSIDFSIAPTDGCTWKRKCNCPAVSNNPGVKCTGKGNMPYGTETFTDLVFECDGVSVLRPKPTEFKEIELDGSGEELGSGEPVTSSQTLKTKKPTYPEPVFVGRFEFDEEDLIGV